MPFKPGQGGRQLGAKNKITLAAKEAFQAAFDAVGGVERLRQFAQENYAEFIKIYGKLIPTEGSLTVDVKPQANVFPESMNDGHQLPVTSEAVDRVH